jgi:lipoprotein-anchoring transpeptidase ErfK/SrfK
MNTFVTRLVLAMLIAALMPALALASPDRSSADESGLEIEASLSEREMYVYRNGERIRTYSIAIGQPDHPTPTGDFSVHQIDWNPDWTPPDSEWSEDEEYTPPGHPDNPMGRARIIFDRPYTIHGTDDVDSLGEAASHGSIRMSNPDVIELATIIMEAAGEARPESWYDEVLENEGEMVEIALPDRIPFTIRE